MKSSNDDSDDSDGSNQKRSMKFDSGNSDQSVNSEEEKETFSKKSPAEQILWACEKGRYDLVSQLIERDSSLIHVRDEDQYTPLHRASYNNHVNIIKVLLKAGASVACQTVDNWTPLHSACKWNNYACVSLLLDEGADINAKTNSGQTPLHLAATNRSAKETLQILLLNYLIDTTATNSVGETAKQIARRCGPFSYMFEGDDTVLDPFP